MRKDGEEVSAAEMLPKQTTATINSMRFMAGTFLVGA